MKRDTTVDTLPAVTYQRISTRRRYTLTGPNRLPTARYQFSCWALADVTTTDLSGAAIIGVKNVANEVVKAFDGWAGMMGSVEVGSAFIVGESDNDDPELGIYRVDVDALITYTETV